MTGRACDTADNSRIARSPNASAICLPDTVITAFPSPYRLIAATSMPSANSVFPLLGAPATNVTRSRSSKFIMPPNTTSLALLYLTNPEPAKLSRSQPLSNTICGATTPSWHLQQRRQHINGHFHLSQMPVIQQLNVCTLIVATKAVS